MMESVKWSHLLCIILSKYDVSILKNERLVFVRSKRGIANNLHTSSNKATSNIVLKVFKYLQQKRYRTTKRLVAKVIFTLLVIAKQA